MARMTRAERQARKLEFQRIQEEEKRLRDQLEQERANVSGVDTAKDFAGNFAWGLAETLMIPTVMDVASEVKEDGIYVPGIGQTQDLSKEFGSDEWVDESLAGKLGYALGTGAGIISGIGAIGKGITLGSKAFGAGRAAAAAGLKKKASKELVDVVDDDAFKLIDAARESIEDGIKTNVRATKPFAFMTRRSIKRNPLGNEDILASASNVMRKNLSDMGYDIDKIAPLVDITLREAGESLTKNYGSSITSALLKGPLQNSPRLAQIAGDMGYEAVLLGIYDTVLGEVGELSASYMGLEENDAPGLFKDWYARAAHGALIGAALAPVRYIPGGKSVEFGRSGMIADIGHMGRFIKSRFKNPEKLSDAQLQMSLKTILGAADEVPEFLANSVKGFVPALVQPGFQLSKPQREILISSYKALQGKTGHFMKKMAAEIARDGGGSFWRASAGSLVMNASMYKEGFESGAIGTDEYPWDKLLADHYIGMLYMKRGKTFKDEPRMKQFYDMMGQDGTGVELSKFVKSMDVLGYDSNKLAAINGYATNSEEASIQNLKERMVEEHSPAITKNNERVMENTITPVERNQRMQEDPNLNVWKIHAQNESTNLSVRIEAESDPAIRTQLQKERNILRDKIVVAEALERDGLEGSVGKVTRPMTREESLVYVDKLSSTRFNGEKLKPLTASSIINRERKQSVGMVTERIRNLELDYIEGSLADLGFPSETDALGNVIIHPTVVKALQTIPSKYYIDKANGESINKYIHAAKSLENTLVIGEQAGYVTVTSEKGGIRDISQVIDTQRLDAFKERYETSADLMHQEVFADKTIENSRWRDTMPLYSSKDSGFLDPYIMSSKPVWHALNTYEMHERNRTAYEIFSNKDNNYTDQYNETIGLIFKGKERIHLDLDVESLPGDIQAANISETQIVVNRLNDIKSMLDPGGALGSQPVRISEITGTLNDNLVKNLGKIAGENILKDNSSYNSLLQHIKRQFIDDLTGNTRLTSGLREAIISGLNPDNPITRRDGKALEIITGDRLLEILTKMEINPNISGNRTDMEATKALVREYQLLVEGPLKRSFKDNVKNIRFVDDMDINAELFSPNEIKQAIKELSIKADYTTASDFEGLYLTSGDLNISIAEKINSLKGAVDTSGKINKELAQEITNLSNSGDNIRDMLNAFARNNDAIGLRAMLDQTSDIYNIANRIKSGPGTPEAIRDYIDAIDSVILKNREKRAELLNLDEIKDLDNYIQETIDNISTKDRSGRPHAGNTSISDSQYVNRWWSGDMTALERLKKTPQEMLRGLGVLNKSQQLLVDYADQELKNGNLVPTIEDFKRILPEFDANKYVEIFVKPIVEANKKRVEDYWDKSISHIKKDLGNTPEEAYRNFVTDTFFVLQSGLGNKKFPMAVFNNGVLEVAETGISTWQRGISRLESRLGLEDSGLMLLAGSRYGTERAIRTRLTKEVMKEMEVMTEAGALVDIDPTNILAEGDKALYKKYGHLASGSGKEGTGQFASVNLDENTMIFLHQDSYKKIINSWANADSQNRMEMLTALKLRDIKDPESLMNEYLQRELNADINEHGVLDIKPTVDNVKTLTLLTRLLTASQHRLADVVNQKVSLSNSRAGLKYLKLDSPRTGVPLDNQNGQFTKAYLEQMLPANDILRKPLKTFNDHTFKANGEETNQRVLVIKDESDGGEAFFSTQERGLKQVQSILEKERGMSPDLAATEAAKIMNEYKPIVASIANGATYLSLPEMTSMLMRKGARPDWFVWENGEVVGFNVAIKPIIHHTKIDPATGESTVFVGKTAYTYDPKIDALMKRSDGSYFLDSVTFESSVKENATIKNGKYESTDIDPAMEPTGNDWVKDLTGRVQNAGQDNIYDLPRESIFIKSISGQHDGTMSNAFGNFLTRDAKSAIESITRTDKTIDDVMKRYSQIAQSPLGMLKVAQSLGNNTFKEGDNMLKLIGIEGVVQSGGIPSFEFMAPQLQRQVTSEYLGKRNFTSSTLTNGAYTVMAPALDLSAPIRKGGIQERFGGSGISWTMGDKSISQLLGGSNEGITLIFNPTKALAKKHNLDVEGKDYFVTFDGVVEGPAMNDGIKKDLLKAYNEVVSKARMQPGLETLSDLVMFIDGKPSERSTSLKDNIVDNSSKAAMANTINNGVDYNTVHIANVDLRTPMAGANDRVITKIEKVLNKKRGPVSEMNMLDVIDPQDADFDLDKSSQFFALPGQVMKEVYNLSGYMEPASDQFTKILDEVILTDASDLWAYRREMIDLASKRGAVVRSHSVSSFLYEMGANINPNVVIPKGKPARDLRPEDAGFNVFSYKDNDTNSFVEVKFKGGREYVESIQYTKSLIKETIDIYKRSGKIDPKQIEAKVYEDTQGMFEITTKKAIGGGYGEPTVINASAIPSKKGKELFRVLVNDVLNPISDIFNIANMTEVMSDGTRRKMSLWEINNTFQQAKAKMKIAAKNNKELDPFIDNLIGYLGEGYVDTNASGVSHSPLIKGLISIEKGLRSQFKGINRFDSELGKILASTEPQGNDLINNAIKGTLSDQKKYAQLEYAAWEINQIEDYMASLAAYGKRNSTRYKDAQIKLDNRNTLLRVAREQLTDIEQFKDQKPFVKRSKGVTKPNVPMKVFRPDRAGELQPLTNIFPGDTFFHRKNDTIIPNFKRLQVANDIVSQQRRAMHKAFARQVNGMEGVDLYVINNLYSEYRDAIKGIDITSDSPSSFNKYGIISNTQLSYLSEYIKKAYNLAPSGKGEAMVKQFLYRMLTPGRNDETFDIVGYDYVNKDIKAQPSFKSNIQNERLVFTFLDKAKMGKAREVIDPKLADELHTTIVNEHKKAIMLEHNPSLKGDVFRFQSFERDPLEMSILPKPKTLPQWMLDPNLNRTAKNIMISYLDGSYFMDPVELYRMTYNLYKNNLGSTPNPEHVLRVMNDTWGGIDRAKLDSEGRWFNSRSIFNEGNNFQLKSIKEEGAVNGLMRKHKLGDGC